MLLQLLFKSRDNYFPYSPILQQGSLPHGCKLSSNT